MSSTRPLAAAKADPRFDAVSDDMRATRMTDFIDNPWRRLAFGPALPERSLAGLERLMGARADRTA
jgi:hypothetical protein